MVTLADIQQYQDALIPRTLSEATIARRLNSIKEYSISFAYQTGYNRFDVGRMVKIHKSKKTLNERYLTEEQVLSHHPGGDRPTQSCDAACLVQRRAACLRTE